QSAADPIALETLKDFATNELFRSEVYVKGPLVRSESELRFYFEHVPFGTLVPRAMVKREVKLPAVTIDYSGPLYDTVLSALAVTPASAAALAERPELAGVGVRRIGDLVQNLALGAQVVPMRTEDNVSAPTREGGGAMRLRVPFNDTALDEALAHDGPLALA